MQYRVYYKTTSRYCLLQVSKKGDILELSNLTNKRGPIRSIFPDCYASCHEKPSKNEPQNHEKTTLISKHVSGTFQATGRGKYGYLLITKYL